MGDERRQEVGYHVQLYSQRIFEDGLKYDTLIKENAKNVVHTNYELVDYFYGICGAGAHQFINYITAANRLNKPLPSYSLGSSTINLVDIKQAVINREGTTNITELSAVWNNLLIEDWMFYWLQSNHGLNIDTYYLYYYIEVEYPKLDEEGNEVVDEEGNVIYETRNELHPFRYSTYSLDYTNNLINSIFSSITLLRTKINNITDILSVTPIVPEPIITTNEESNTIKLLDPSNPPIESDKTTITETTDTVTGIITTVATRIIVELTTMSENSTDLEGNIIVIQVPAVKTTTIITTTVQLPTTQDIIEKLTYTEEYLIDVYNDYTLEFDIKNELTETLTVSHNEYSVGKTVVTIIENKAYPSSTKTINIKRPPTVPSYVIKYKINTESRIWVYFPSLGNYPEINQSYVPLLSSLNSVEYSSNILPMTMLRGSHYNVDEYETTSKEIPANDYTWIINTPSFITEQAYDDADTMLSSLALNIDDVLESIADNPDAQYLSDVFFGFAVSPTDDHPIVSKLIHEFYKELDLKLNLSSNRDTHYIDFKDGNYNNKINFLGLSRYTESKIIGDIGTYKHEIQEGGEESNVPSFLEYPDELFFIYTDYVEKISQGKREPNGLYGVVVDVYEEEYLYSYYWGEDPDYTGSGEQIPYISKLIKQVLTTEVLTKEYLNYDEAYARGYIDLVGNIIKDEVRTTIKTEPNLYTGGKILKTEYQISSSECETIYVIGLTGSTAIGWSPFGNDTTEVDAYNEALLLPIPIHLLNTLSPLEKVDLIERSARLILYSEQLHVVVYYTTSSFFQFFMQIASVVIIALTAVFSGGSATPISVALGSALQSAVVGVGISLAVKLFLTMSDSVTLNTIVKIVSVLAIAYISGITDLVDIVNLAITIADELVSLTTQQTLSGIEKDYSKLIQEKEQFSEEYEERIEAIEATLDTLGEGLTLADLLDINTNQTEYVPYTTPSDYFRVALNTHTNYELLYKGGFDKVNAFYEDKFNLKI